MIAINNTNTSDSQQRDNALRSAHWPGAASHFAHPLQQNGGTASLSDELVAAMSGDCEFTAEQKAAAERLQREQGGGIFSQLLFALSHQCFPESEAETRWYGILRHKYEMSEKLGRNVGVAVAALDYLANLRHDITAPVIISRPSMDAIMQMAIEDPLTRVANRASVLLRLEDEIMRARRYGTPCSLLMLDLDNFKQINDTLGHSSGDDAIRDFAARMCGVLREVDLCGRFGGDEFMVLLPDSATADAVLVAERIVQCMRQPGDGHLFMTCSIGIASCPEHGGTVTEILTRADQALLDAKRAGKNRATVFSPPPTPVDGASPQEARDR